MSFCRPAAKKEYRKTSREKIFLLVFKFTIDISKLVNIIH